MLNQAAEILHSKENNDSSKKDRGKLEKAASTESANGKKKKIKSPSTPKRLLPSTPSFLKSSKEISRSSEDVSTKKKDVTVGAEKAETLAAKYKYNSLPRKAKHKGRQQLSSSTFYIQEKDENPSNASPRSKRKEVTRSDSNSSSNSSYNDKQTHVALYKFYARHKDELAFIDGDPIQVVKMFDDLWYEGINLSTGKQGIFPCRYVADILSHEISSSVEEASDHRQFHLRFLGSVEVSDYKGDEVLCFAIAKVVNQRSLLSTSTPPSCTLQVNSKGIRICNLEHLMPNQDIDRKAKKGKQIENSILDDETTHYFSLKNVTFCGNHPKDRRYFGFITKHPDEHRFACHIFMSKYSTDQLAKVIGDCFQKFYETYLEYRAPTEDIYLE